MITVMRARYVLAFRDADHVLLENADVVYEDGVIVHAGSRWTGDADELIEAGNALVLPGFIDLDAVADIDHALLDSWSSGEHSLGFEWSEDYWRNRRHDVFTTAERIEIREFALVQMLLHGITTCMPIASETHSSWAESYDEMVGMAEVAERLGIRAYLGPAFRSGINAVRDDGTPDVLWDPAEGERGLEDALRFLRHVEEQPGDLVRGALLPCRIETMTLDLLRATAKAAVETGVPVRLHCLQGGHELELLRQWYGRGPVEILEETGFLDANLLVPHGIYLDAAGRARLAEAGVSVVHCPLTTARYGMVLRSFDKCRDAGINMALGTDSFPPDLIRVMDCGNNLMKVVDERLDAGSVPDYVRAATLGGARALRRPDLGRIAPGAQADLAVIGLDDPRLGVLDDPVRTVVMSGSGRDVRMTVVAGRTVMRDGEIPGLDLARMSARAQELFERMRAAYSERDHQRRSTAQLFPPAFDLVKE